MWACMSLLDTLRVSGYWRDGSPLAATEQPESGNEDMALTAQQTAPSYLPTRDELVARAKALTPVLRDRAEQTEDLGCIPDETIADLKAAGLHKLFTPARYGGYEVDWGTHVAVSRELARGCGSTGWIGSIVMSHTWMLARFPADTQEAFWPEHPDAIICTASAGGGSLEDTEVATLPMVAGALPAAWITPTVCWYPPSRTACRATT